MLMVVVFLTMYHYIGKAASCNTITTPIYNGTKKYKTSKLLQNN